MNDTIQMDQKLQKGCTMNDTIQINTKSYTREEKAKVSKIKVDKDAMLLATKNHVSNGKVIVPRDMMKHAFKFVPSIAHLKYVMENSRDDYMRKPCGEKDFITEESSSIDKVLRSVKNLDGCNKLIDTNIIIPVDNTQVRLLWKDGEYDSPRRSTGIDMFVPVNNEIYELMSSLAGDTCNWFHKGGIIVGTYVGEVNGFIMMGMYDPEDSMLRTVMANFVNIFRNEEE